MNLEHLRALAAIIDEGTFEAAADLLCITPSAVSQRIKTLEASVGQIVVRRGVPSTPPRRARSCSGSPDSFRSSRPRLGTLSAPVPPSARLLPWP
ncbi:LysR family transcriptional regulator [Arthrobacter sp. JZ12]|uniref:LysR family transcriptional regulator n=1 Tax=Arthrobacter sp. JZ12 TaxID=2654190 RepID=UPI002B49F0C0|nr:LysR family transcriptional regulator [Arthrobacter sp. JZ12]